MNKEVCFIDLVKSITVGGVTIPIEELNKRIALRKAAEAQDGNKDMQ